MRRGNGIQVYALYVLLGRLRLVALSLAVCCCLAYLAGLALGLQIADLFDEDRVDLKQRGDAILIARLCDGRHGRRGNRLDRRLDLGEIGLHLGHMLGLAAVGDKRVGRGLWLGSGIWLASGTGWRGRLAVLGKLVLLLLRMGGRGQGLRVGRGRVRLLQGGYSKGMSDLDGQSTVAPCVRQRRVGGTSLRRWDGWGLPRCMPPVKGCIMGALLGMLLAVDDVARPWAPMGPVLGKAWPLGNWAAKGNEGLDGGSCCACG